MVQVKFNPLETQLRNVQFMACVGSGDIRVIENVNLIDYSYNTLLILSSSSRESA